MKTRNTLRRIPRRRAKTSTLPGQPGALIGRARELAVVVERLQDADVRLLTITGTAGAGKTRLAVAAAGLLQRDALAQDGVYFADLAPIHDSRLVPAAIGRAVGVREARGELGQARVERHIGDKRLLLVLDNFEQVLPAAPAIAQLLSSCQNLKILVTSRARLRLRWEQVLPLAPLAVPNLRELPRVPELEQISSVALFVSRARAVDPSFQLTERNAPQVAEICIRLDGLPLAIELAAARSDVTTPAEVLARLHRSFDLQARGGVDLPERQQSLEAAFASSYALLSAEDQAIFSALSVFVGGFSPEMAVRLVGRDDLSALVQHSLVRREPTSGQTRFRMLEPVRAYALECLERNRATEEISRKHAELMLELAEQAAPALLGADQAEWLGRLEREHDNLSAALHWAIDQHEQELSLRLAVALWRFWWLHGHLSEGVGLLQAVLQVSTRVADSQRANRASALNAAGVLAHVLGDYARARTLLQQSLELSQQAGSKTGMAAALHNLGALAREQAHWPAALEAYEQSLALERELGNAWGIATSLTNLGALAADRGDTPRAAALLEESLALLRQIGDVRGVASALHNLADVARDAGDWARAAALHEESLPAWRTLGDRWGLAVDLHDLARVLLRNPRSVADLARAAQLLGESLEAFVELGVRQGIAGCLEGLAAVACGSHRAREATRLLGAAEALREHIDAPLAARDRSDLARIVSLARTHLSAPDFRAAWQGGRGASLETALRDARGVVRLAQPSHSPRPSWLDQLSDREVEVARLVGDGLTNRQIAERLVISERTADRHVSNILAKLGLHNRTQVVARVAGADWVPPLGTSTHD